MMDSNDQSETSGRRHPQAIDDRHRIVLYIEDDANNVRLVERLMDGRPGATLIVARSGHDGIEAAVRQAPDLILLDNRLPDATGSDVLAQLNLLPALSPVPVVILTGDSDRSTAENLISMGATEVLAKPFDIYAFWAMIDRHLNSCR